MSQRRKEIMRSFASFFSLILLLASSCLYAAAPPDGASGDYGAGRLSIGLNDLPWHANRVSLRWWNDNNRGKELNINEISLAYNYYPDDDYSIMINTQELSLYFLRRDPLSVAYGMYFVKGVGLGLGFKGRFSRETLYEGVVMKSSSFSIPLTIHFPFGIEHFFWNRCKNISYSIDADIHATIQYNYEKNNVVTRHIYTSFGVASKFFLRFYF